MSKVFYYEGIVTKAFYRDLHPQATLWEFKAAKERKKAYFKALKALGIPCAPSPSAAFMTFPLANEAQMQL